VPAELAVYMTDVCCVLMLCLASLTWSGESWVSATRHSVVAGWRSAGCWCKRWFFPWPRLPDTLPRRPDCQS